MLCLARQNGLLAHPRHIAAIPVAGEPLLDGFFEAIISDAGDAELEKTDRLAAGAEWHRLQRFRLRKVANGNRRRVELDPNDIPWRLEPKSRMPILLFDDLVNWGAASKIEIIREIIKECGNVTDMIVFFDYGRNTTEALTAAGVRLHAVWKLELALEWLYGHNSGITRAVFKDTLERITAFYQYVEQHC